MVVELVMFGLLAVLAFLESINMPTADCIRGETVIAINSDDPLFRLHT